MFHELHIRGLGVIESASLVLGPGLTVATGETGAGKTLLLTAISLLTGTRADPSLVRAGAEAAVIEAVVEQPDGGEDWGVEPGEQLLVAREVPADGRSRARINGRLAPASALADLFGDRVEIHAQHEHVRLARPDVQRGLVDRHAGEAHAAALARVRAAWDRQHAATQALARADGAERERELRQQALERDLQEIDAAKLDEDVDAHLDDLIDVLANAQDFQEAAHLVEQAVGEQGAGEALAQALGAMRRLPVGDGPWAKLQERIEELLLEARDVAATVRDLHDGIEAEPSRLGQLQERKRLVTELCRRFGPTVVDVLAVADAAREELDLLASDGRGAGALAAELAEATDAMTAAAAEVTSGRRDAALQLQGAVAGHLADLAMPHATFRVEIRPAAPGPNGADEVVFLLAANPGEPEAELGKAASGGERSRVALAIEVALADVHDADVLVFDEVDAGIGGATALAVGEKLARLARGRQVLCVTHLAQLAAFADAHHVVEKSLVDGRTVTTVRRVEPEQRADELARMLSGEPGEAGIGHAAELLALAARKRST